jgi:hypothetical protein
MKQSNILFSGLSVPVSGLQAVRADAGPKTSDITNIKHKLNTS